MVIGNVCGISLYSERIQVEGYSVTDRLQAILAMYHIRFHTVLIPRLGVCLLCVIIPSTRDNVNILAASQQPSNEKESCLTAFK